MRKVFYSAIAQRNIERGLVHSTIQATGPVSDTFENINERTKATDFIIIQSKLITSFA